VAIDDQAIGWLSTKERSAELEAARLTIIARLKRRSPRDTYEDTRRTYFVALAARLYSEGAQLIEPIYGQRIFSPSIIKGIDQIANELGVTVKTALRNADGLREFLYVARRYQRQVCGPVCVCERLSDQNVRLRNRIVFVRHAGLYLFHKAQRFLYDRFVVHSLRQFHSPSCW
jgi:hypothetical protein